MLDNLILSTVQNLEYDAVAPFLESLRATGSMAKVHFFVRGVSADSIRKMESLGVSTQRFHYLNFRHRQPLLVLWPVWRRMLARRGFAGKCALAKKIFHLMGVRFAYYYDYLEKNRARFQNVLLTDCRDVYFQRDPFAEPIAPGIHCFLEARTQIIGTCPHNTRMFQKTFPQGVLAKLAKFPVSCAGTTLGDVESILVYLKAMIETLCAAEKMYSGSDQAVHNYLIHQGLLPQLHLHDNYGGLVFTAGCESAESIRLNQQGEVIRNDSSAYSILHQYDRHKDLCTSLLTKLRH